MGRFGQVWFSGFVAAIVATLGAVPAPAAAADVPEGRGTSGIDVALVRATVGGAEFEVGEVVADVTIDPERHGIAQSRAEGEVAVVRSTGTGADLVFPDPPLKSRTVRGKHEGGVEAVSVAVPPVRVDSAPAQELIGPLLPNTPSGLPTRPGPPAARPVERGEIADGEIRPASLRTMIEGGVAEVVSQSDIGRLSLLQGVSTLDGAGLSDHRAWSQSADAGAEARSLHVRSATLLEIRALLRLLGLDADGLVADVKGALTSALGPGAVPPGTDPLSVPLIALTEVSATARAVAAVGPDGTPHTAVASEGSVGGVFVGSVQLEGFSTDETSEDWNDLEDKIHHQLDKVLGTLGERYKGSVRVRVLPRLVLGAETDGEYVSARAEMALLAVQVTPPPPLEGVEPGSPGEGEGGGLPTVPELPTPGGGGGLPGIGLTMSRAAGGAAPPPVTIEFAALDVEAEHAREGVAVDCSTLCGPGDGSEGSSQRVVNRPWSPHAGFGAPSTANDLPRTGGRLGLLPLVVTAAVAGAGVMRQISAGAGRARTRPIQVSSTRRVRP